jgi:hypothetical protein
VSGPIPAPLLVAGAHAPIHRTAPWPIAFFRSQVLEISTDGVLRTYGACLALTHVLSVMFWLTSRSWQFMHEASEVICWPLVPWCGSLRVLSPGQAWCGVVLFGGAAMAVALAFARQRWTPAAYTGLFLLTIVKVVLMALDYRLRLNQHYMAFWACAVYLLVPGKRDALRLLLVLFYFWAGMLKVNWEWLSGAGLYRPLWLFTGRGVVVACAYVVVMELLVVWGLLARRSWIFWGAFAQVMLFHVMSWAVVQFFYPLLMFLLLSLFVLDRLFPRADTRTRPLARTSLLSSLMHGRARLATYVAGSVFTAFQLVPYTFPGDRTITGEGRLYALHMFDAQVVCEAWAVLTDGDGTGAPIDLRAGTLPRINCDPIVVLGRARNLCARLGRPGAPANLHVVLRARRSTEPDLRTVIDLPSFCALDLHYDPFRHNDWIHLAGTRSGQ